VDIERSLHALVCACVRRCGSRIHIAGGTRRCPLARGRADPIRCHRVLRHLVSKGLFAEPAPGSSLSMRPRGAVGESAAWAWISTALAAAWRTPGVRCCPPCAAVAGVSRAFGLSFWEDLEAHPEIAASFDALMGPGHASPIGSAGGPRGLGIGPNGSGRRGRHGALWRRSCARAEVRGTLVDLRGRCAGRARIFQAAGVADRVTTVAQSFSIRCPRRRSLRAEERTQRLARSRGDGHSRRCAEAAPIGPVVAFTGAGRARRRRRKLLMMILVGGRGGPGRVPRDGSAGGWSDALDARLRGA